jgi:hypothetical protein
MFFSKHRNPNFDFSQLLKQVFSTRRHPGGTQEAPRRHPGGPRTPRRLQRLLKAIIATPLEQNAKVPLTCQFYDVFLRVRSPSSVNYNRKSFPTTTADQQTFRRPFTNTARTPTEKGFAAFTSRFHLRFVFVFPDQGKIKRLFVARPPQVVKYLPKSGDTATKNVQNN